MKLISTFHLHFSELSLKYIIFVPISVFVNGNNTASLHYTICEWSNLCQLFFKSYIREGRHGLQFVLIIVQIVTCVEI